MIFNFFNHNSPEPGYNRFKPHSSKGITLAYLIDVLEVFQVSLKSISLLHGDFFLFFPCSVPKWKKANKPTRGSHRWRTSAALVGSLASTQVGKWTKDSYSRTFMRSFVHIHLYSGREVKNRLIECHKKILRCLDRRSENLKVEAMSMSQANMISEINC